MSCIPFRRSTPFLALVVGGVLALAGCGGDVSGSAGDTSSPGGDSSSGSVGASDLSAPKGWQQTFEAAAPPDDVCTQLPEAQLEQFAAFIGDQDVTIESAPVFGSDHVTCTFSGVHPAGPEVAVEYSFEEEHTSSCDPNPWYDDVEYEDGPPAADAEGDHNYADPESEGMVNLNRVASMTFREMTHCLADGAGRIEVTLQANDNADAFAAVNDDDALLRDITVALSEVSDPWPAWRELHASAE